jgi:hypothetical protein
LYKYLRVDHIALLFHPNLYVPVKIFSFCHIVSIKEESYEIKAVFTSKIRRRALDAKPQHTLGSAPRPARVYTESLCNANSKCAHGNFIIAHLISCARDLPTRRACLRWGRVMHHAGGPRRAGCLASAAAHHCEREREAHFVMVRTCRWMNAWRAACITFPSVGWHAGQEHMSLAPHSAYQSAASITHTDARHAE